VKFSNRVVRGGERPFTRLLRAVCVSLVIIFPLSTALAVPTHLDRTKMKQGCRTCHKGHGQKGTMLLIKTRDELCFECHGTQAGNRASDIYSVVTKKSNHPVIQTSQYHVSGEELPDDYSLRQRHASCFDCHNVHTSEKGKTFKGLSGYRGNHVKVKQATYEYEICFKCHADSANAPVDVSQDFDVSNVSFHPVESFGKSSIVPSLRRGRFSASSLITCSDCHGNDDRSGPKGPHGSIYAPILKFQDDNTLGPESPERYRLCYECHDRTSILSDQSFKAHKTHIIYNRISCSQCHSAHGSRTNPSLINFDSKFVFPTARGQILFTAGTPGTPKCLLSCHVNGISYEHTLNAKLSYCVNSKCPPNW
jgi:predicted CXXCH cytochrome family protein